MSDEVQIVRFVRVPHALTISQTPIWPRRRGHRLTGHGPSTRLSVDEVAADHLTISNIPKTVPTGRRQQTGAIIA
jgi:hypothetical protein